MSALADALPDAMTSTGGDATSHARAVSEVRRALQSGQSLRSRTGVQKRREEVARVERERFKGNLGVMGGVGRGDTAGGAGGDANPAGEAGGAAGGTWAALRAHIASALAKPATVAVAAASTEEEVL